MFKYKLIPLVFFLALGAGCASNPIPDPDPDPTDTTYGDESGADTDAYGSDGMGEGEFFDEGFGEDLEHVFYFDFDSSELRPEYTDTVRRHAMVLADNPNASVRLEGHADERGSREYNIGLGERRSQTVRRMLLIQGAAAGQIQTVSFGEERPVALGSTEEAYAQNRRVEIKYID
ncbi:MAG: peptidoglycan-associated lipoprotein Pal [Woeseiaceae bacterium]|nr:peptidoglycan-associated lipoprotein Pal [Woeseiaceae bacterium]